MTKFEISDAMLNAAEQAYDTIAAIEHDAWCHTAPTRAAITAAIEASGLPQRLAACEDRLMDLLQVDDGQASKEARKYLKKHRPELFAPIDKEPTL